MQRCLPTRDPAFPPDLLYQPHRRSSARLSTPLSDQSLLETGDKDITCHEKAAEAGSTMALLIPYDRARIAIPSFAIVPIRA